MLVHGHIYISFAICICICICICFCQRGKQSKSKTEKWCAVCSSLVTSTFFCTNPQILHQTAASSSSDTFCEKKKKICHENTLLNLNDLFKIRNSAFLKYFTKQCPPSPLKYFLLKQSNEIFQPPVMYRDIS